MSDFLQEVEDDIKRENAEKLWAKYSGLVYGLIALIIASVGGYNYYVADQLKASNAAGAKYENALMLAKEGKSKEAGDQLASIIAEGGRYKDIARLKLTSENADPTGALASLTAITKDLSTDAALRDLATLRLAFNTVDTASYDDVFKLLEPLSKSGHAYKMSSLELLGLSAFKAGKTLEAENHMKLLIADNDATDSAKARANIVLNSITATKK